MENNPKEAHQIVRVVLEIKHNLKIVLVNHKARAKKEDNYNHKMEEMDKDHQEKEIFVDQYANKMVDKHQTK